MAARPFFGNNISPACEYCAQCRRTANGALQCPFGGAVEALDQCEKFLYAPLRRVPRKAPPLPSFSPEDFKL